MDAVTMASAGITPCTPLLLLTGYCLALSPGYAAAAGCSFGIATAAGLAVLLAAVSGILSKKLAADMPEGIRWFRLASYLALVILPFVIGLGE